MTSLNRRAFLGSAVFGAATALSGAPLYADDPRPRDKPVFRPDTLFLTWQRDPTTTITIQWVGKERGTAETIVYSALDRNAVETWQMATCRVRPYPMTDLHVFRAELTGLSPDTDYQFRIGMDSPAYRFHTMPAKATSGIHFVSGGDCGVDKHAVGTNIQAARQDPMFVVIGGDLGYDNGRSAETSLAFLRNYSKHMIGRDGRLIPLVVCMGNHEVNGGYGKGREAAPFFFALHDGLFADTSYNVLDFGDYLSLVLLDTGHHSAIGGEQTSWLEKTLAARVDRPHLLVFNHVPAYPSFRAPETVEGKPGAGAGNRAHWVPLFERYNVDVVFEHHDHTFKRTKPLLGGHVDERRGLVYLGDGSWGKLRRPHAPELRSYLASVGEAYHMSLHRLESKQRFHMAIAEGGQIVDVCSTHKRPRSKVVAG